MKGILVGHYNLMREKLGIASDQIERLAQIRGNMCAACDKLHPNTLKCDICGCRVDAKIRYLGATCPDKKW